MMPNLTLQLAFILCIAQVVIIGVSSVYAPISFPVVLVALYFIQKAYLRTSRQLRFLDLEAKSPLYSQFLECLSGLVTIRAFGWGKALEKKNLKLLDQSQRPFYQLFAVQRWLTLVLDLLVAALATLLIVLVVTLRGTLSSGFVGVALLNVILFSQSIKLLITFWTNLETHIGSIARIKTFTTHAATEDLPFEIQSPPPTWPARGSIDFTGVSAAYRYSPRFIHFEVSYSHLIDLLNWYSRIFLYPLKQGRRSVFAGELEGAENNLFSLMLTNSAPVERVLLSSVSFE
jgi:ABC-type multidrug transport system fused ATPase/permease subunit